MNTHLQRRVAIAFNKHTGLKGVLLMCDEDDHIHYLAIVDKVLNSLPFNPPIPPEIKDIPNEY